MEHARTWPAATHRLAEHLSDNEVRNESSPRGCCGRAYAEACLARGPPSPQRVLTTLLHPHACKRSALTDTSPLAALQLLSSMRVYVTLATCSASIHRSGYGHRVSRWSDRAIRQTPSMELSKTLLCSLRHRRALVCTAPEATRRKVGDDRLAPSCFRFPHILFAQLSLHLISPNLTTPNLARSLAKRHQHALLNDHLHRSHCRSGSRSCSSGPQRQDRDLGGGLQRTLPHQGECEERLYRRMSKGIALVVEGKSTTLILLLVSRAPSTVFRLHSSSLPTTARE